MICASNSKRRFVAVELVFITLAVRAMTVAACQVHGEFAAYGERNANDEPPFTRHETDRVARTVAAVS